MSHGSPGRPRRLNIWPIEKVLDVDVDPDGGEVLAHHAAVLEAVREVAGVEDRAPPSVAGQAAGTLEVGAAERVDGGVAEPGLTGRDELVGWATGCAQGAALHAVGKCPPVERRVHRLAHASGANSGRRVLSAKKCRAGAAALK